MDRADIVLEVLNRVECIRALDVVAVFLARSVVRTTYLGVTHLVGDVDTALNQFLGSLLVGSVRTTGSHFHIRAVTLGELHAVVNLRLLEDSLFLFAYIVDTCPRSLKSHRLVAQVLGYCHEVNQLGTGVGRDVVRADVALVGVVTGIEHILHRVETEQTVAEFVAYIVGTLLLNLLHLLCVAEHGVHTVFVERPRVDMRVDVVVGSGTEKECLAQLPVAAGSRPRLGSSLYVGVGQALCLKLVEDVFAVLVEGDGCVRQVLVGGNHRVVHIRCHRCLQGLFFL